MTLPTFVGIGVARGGTTWLHTMLSGHPKVFMPTHRKEIRFFDRNYDRGLGWYEGFFPEAAEVDAYDAIGEISPQYFYCSECPERVAATLPAAKLIAILRHPVDRAYSHYGFVVQRRNFQGSFEEFLAMRPNMLEKGFYSRSLDRYVRYFDRDRILAIVFEKAVRDDDAARKALSTFLELPVDGFPQSIGRVNASSVPRFGALSNFAVTTGRRLRKTHLEKAVDLGARLGVRDLLTRGKALPRLDADLRAQLSRRFAEEFDVLECRYHIDVGAWRR
jgi:sulfotransferase family protein